MRTAIGDLGERRIAVARGPRTEAFVRPDARNEVADICFVVDIRMSLAMGYTCLVSCWLRL